MHSSCNVYKCVIFKGHFKLKKLKISKYSRSKNNEMKERHKATYVANNEMSTETDRV